MCKALPPPGLAHLLFHTLENTFSAARMLDSFSHPPGLCSNVPPWQRLPLTISPTEGPSLDTVIIYPGSFKALTTMIITQLFMVVYTLAPFLTLAAHHKLRTRTVSTVQRFLRTWPAVEPGHTFVLRAPQAIQPVPSQG